MLQIQIPVGAASWRQRVVLEGKAYYLACALSLRVNRWFFSLSDDAQTPIISGRKILAGKDLLRGIASTLKPPGSLFAFDESGRDRDPNEALFGTEIQLIYATSDEVAGVA